MPYKLLSEFVVKQLYCNWKKINATHYAINRYDEKNDNINLSTTKTNYCGPKIEFDEFPTKKFVVKVDQGIKGRMKKGLVGLNLNSNEIYQWIKQVDNKYVNFIVEPMITNIVKEIYLLIRNVMNGIEIIVVTEGGIDVNDKMDNYFDNLNIVSKIILNHGELLKYEQISQIVNEYKIIIPTIMDLFNFYQQYHLTFLEINPLAIVLFDNEYINIPIDMLAKYDSCSLYLWNPNDKKIVDNMTSIEFGITQEEKYIEMLGQKTGSSLKFKLFNPNSRIWFILFGGGASVCFFDKWMKILMLQKNHLLDESRLKSENHLNDSPLSHIENHELMPANYGEMSGNPNREFVYEYTKQILFLIEKSKAPSTKNKPYYLIIGGGIANFTLVDKTFMGIIDALSEHINMLLEKNIVIYVRRGGPNYRVGLDLLREFCQKHEITCYAHGPKMPMTQILDMISETEFSDSSNESRHDIQVYETIN